MAGTTEYSGFVDPSYDFVDKFCYDIRFIIYEFVLINKTPIMITEANAQHQKEPGLLRTNKLIRREAKNIFYKGNRFPLVIDSGAFGDNPTFAPFIWLRNRMRYDLQPQRLELALLCTVTMVNDFARWHAHGESFSTYLGTPDNLIRLVGEPQSLARGWRCLNRLAKLGVDLDEVEFIPRYGYQRLQDRDAKVGTFDFWKVMCQLLVSRINEGYTLYCNKTATHCYFVSPNTSLYRLGIGMDVFRD